MRKKDEAQEELRTAISRWGYGAGSYDYILGAIDTYGAACAEEAALVWAKQAQLASDTAAIIDGEPTRGKLKKELSAAEQRGYARGREEASVKHHLDDWYEDDGPVLWWTQPVDEPPWVGTPLDSDWPGYHRYWSRLPAEPKWPDDRSHPQPKREEPAPVRSVQSGSADALTAVVLAWDALKQGSITAGQYEATIEALRPKWTAQEIEAAKIKAADMATKFGEQPEKEPQR